MLHKEREKFDLNELEEILLHAYENAKIYQEKSQKLHDKKLRVKHFHPGQQVLLYDSRLKLFPRKLKSRWIGPYEVVEAYGLGAVRIRHVEGNRTFVMNGHRRKEYLAQAVGVTEQIHLEILQH